MKGKITKASGSWKAWLPQRLPRHTKGQDCLAAWSSDAAWSSAHCRHKWVWHSPWAAARCYRTTGGPVHEKLNLFFFKLSIYFLNFVYLEGRVTVEGRESEPSAALLPSAMAGSGHSQESGTPSGTPTSIAEAQALGQPSAFPTALSGSWMGSGIAGNQTSIQVNACIAGSDLTHCIPAPGSDYFFSWQIKIIYLVCKTCYLEICVYYGMAWLSWFIYAWPKDLDFVLFFYSDS